ncbi:unannotated protein [freshwater metagenome]|uniref:Unannotated protein n=1 Tax=freshwater metagenome TaxID=449393 RepID=A0A6J7JIH9_9ZZZZ
MNAEALNFVVEPTDQPVSETDLAVLFQTQRSA